MLEERYRSSVWMLIIITVIIIVLVIGVDALYGIYYVKM